MRRHLACLALLLLCPLALASTADFPERLEIDNQALVLRNEPLLRYLFVDVYSAALLTPADISPKSAVQQGSPIFLSEDTELARAYVGIWLAEDGLSDNLRQRLLAER